MGGIRARVAFSILARHGIEAKVLHEEVKEFKNKGLPMVEYKEWLWDCAFIYVHWMVNRADSYNLFYYRLWCYPRSQPIPSTSALLPASASISPCSTTPPLTINARNTRKAVCLSPKAPVSHLPLDLPSFAPPTKDPYSILIPTSRWWRTWSGRKNAVTFLGRVSARGEDHAPMPIVRK